MGIDRVWGKLSAGEIDLEEGGLGEERQERG